MGCRGAGLSCLGRVLETYPSGRRKGSKDGKNSTNFNTYNGMGQPLGDPPCPDEKAQESKRDDITTGPTVSKFLFFSLQLSVS